MKNCIRDTERSSDRTRSKSLLLAPCYVRYYSYIYTIEESIEKTILSLFTYSVCDGKVKIKIIAYHIN